MTKEKLVALRVFTDSPDAGESDCLCSKCYQVIGEDDVPIRFWPDPPDTRELRFHQACFEKELADLVNKALNGDGKLLFEDENEVE